MAGIKGRSGVYPHRKGQGGRKGRTGKYKRSPQQIEALRQRLKGIKQNPRSEAFKQNLRELHTGSKAYNWKGGYENHLHLNRLRRIRHLQAPGSHTLAEWLTLKAQYDFTCPSCHRREPEITLTEDHIIPLTKFGSNNIENIQPLCRSCNSKKYNKIIYYANRV
jgi:5-methylcytosine-specific restriction endonuclease McrA